MLKKFFFTLLLATRVLSRIEISDLESLDWLTEIGDEKPILRSVVHGETILLPLRKAPFCHLAEIKKCECFILRKGEDSSDWDVASFVKCGDRLQGNFMSSSRYFEIVPKKEGKSGEHVIKKHKLENSSSEASHDQSADGQEEMEPSENQINSKYLRPLPESGKLFENETGYISTKFVMSQSIYEYLSESDIDAYLQNYMNDANQILSKLNLLFIYRGWIEASDDYSQLDGYKERRFVDGGYSAYDKDGIHDAVILLGPSEWPGSSRSSLGASCLGSSGHFVKFFHGEKPHKARTQLQALLFSMGRVNGIFNIDYNKCGQPPEGVVWIMQDSGQSRKNGSLQWANCTLLEFRKKKANLACLRKKIESSRISCGNGLVEDGEECDCVADECKHCCTEDCKLAKNSVCSNGPCCDVSKCQVFDKKTQCRASEDFCDIPELCDGQSTQCPPNYVVANGYECKGHYDEKGYCFNGMCGNRGDVCVWAFLNGSNADDKCYEMNLENDKEWGGCGPTFQSKKTGGAKYFACSPDNKLCGKIYCVQPGIENESGMKYTNESAGYFLSLDPTLYSGIKNHSSICGFMGLSKSYRSLRIDPTFVPNGSECGDGKMCYKQACRSLPSGCPKNCPGKKIKHPYTDEMFPAFELTDDSGDWGSSIFIWPYLIAGFLPFILIAGSFFLLHYLRSKNTSGNSPRQTPVSAQDGQSPGVK